MTVPSQYLSCQLAKWKSVGLGICRLQFQSSMGPLFQFTNGLGQAAYHTYIATLDPGVNGKMSKDSFYSVAPWIIFVAAVGVYAPQGVDMV